jgi:hypothetical protein
MNNMSKSVSEITLKSLQKKEFYIFNVLDKNSCNPKRINVNGAKLKKGQIKFVCRGHIF